MYPDSDATHHITYGSNNLTTKTIYNGNEFVKLGNGTSINISHIGSDVYKYSYKNAKMVLNNLLDVASILKNLISVYKCA